MSRGRHIAWLPRDDARLEALYLGDRLEAGAIARAMKLDVKRVCRRIHRLGLAARRGETGRWPPGDSERLRRWYVDEEMPPRLIAKRLGTSKERVAHRITVMGLAAERSAMRCAAQARENSAAGVAGRMRARVARGEFVWTPERQADLEALYLPPRCLPPAEIGLRFGISAEQVRWRVHRTGLAKRRAALGVKRRRVRRLTKTAHVVHLGVGHAAGTTRWEDALKTAPPPVAYAANEAEQRARAARGGRATKLKFASRGGGGR